MYCNWINIFKTSDILVRDLLSRLIKLASVFSSTFVIVDHRCYIAHVLGFGENIKLGISKVASKVRL